MLKEIGKVILKSTLVDLGKRVMSEKVVPVVSDASKKAWVKIKEKKDNMSTRNESDEDVVYDAEFTDKE